MFLDKRLRMYYKLISFLVRLNFCETTWSKIPVDSLVVEDSVTIAEATEHISWFDYFVRDRIRDI